MLLRSPALRRRGAGILGALVATLLLLTACSPQQQEALDLLNETRRAHGLPTMLPHISAMTKAQSWAEQLARGDRLAHSTLSEGLTGDWIVVGENVGRGRSIQSVHHGFMQSETHRANVLDPVYNYAGVGHAVGADGRIYIVQVFLQY